MVNSWAKDKILHALFGLKPERFMNREHLLNKTAMLLPDF